MKIDVLVPSKLSDITLEQFVKLQELQQETEGSVFFMQKLVEVICRIELKSVAKIKYTDVSSIYDHVMNLFQEKPVHSQRFTMNGIEYGFIPELDEMTYGEYIDIDENITSWDTMHKAMAVLYRPITDNKDERYDIEKYNGLSKSDRYKNMPVDVALGANFFLFNLGEELLRTTLKYSLQEKGLTMEEKAILQESGVGFRASLDSLREMLQSYDISLK